MGTPPASSPFSFCSTLLLLLTVAEKLKCQFFLTGVSFLKNMLIDKDFSGGPVVKTPSFHTAGDPDLIPAGETKILYVLLCGQKLKKKKAL